MRNRPSIRGAADALRADLRFAFRYFARHKATTAIIVAVLALGTGANTLIFSTFQSQFMRPAPAVPSYAEQSRIHSRERATQTAEWEQRWLSGVELRALAAKRDVFRDVAAWTEDEVIIGGSDSMPARGVNAQYVTANFFGTLGVSLVAGQGLRQESTDAPDYTAVMALAMAEQLYGGAASAIGRDVLVNRVPVRIVGVAPFRFQGALRNMDEPALFMPLSARAGIARVSPRWMDDESRLGVFTRLAPGVSRDLATAFTRTVVAAALPDSAARVGMTRTADVTSMNAITPGQDSSEVVLAFTMIAVVGALILLVAWMNVSSLMVAAAVGRRHEIAVRLSLGASRPRLLRQLVTESTLLAFAGSTIGLTLASWALTAMEKAEIDGVTMAPDAGTLVFVFLMALASGILFGLSPALHATRGGVANALRDSGSGATSKSRLQRVFVVAQIAFSQPLLLILGVMLSLLLGDYQPLAPEMSRQVIRATFRPLEHGAPGQNGAAVDSLLPRLAARPEIVAAVAEPDAFEIRGVVKPARAAGAPADSSPAIVHIEGAAPGWFATVEVPIILGRDVALSDSNAADYPVVIGSDLARALWGDANPLGRTLASPSLPNWKQDSVTLSVVGVYDASHALPGMAWNGQATRGSMSEGVSRAYTARGLHWQRDRVLLRTRGPAAPYLEELQRFVRAQAPELPVRSMQTLAQADAAVYRETLRGTAMAGVAGALALLLASLGLYGVVSLAVRQRTREIGLRIAVGAQPMRVARMFLASGVRLSIIALAIGLPLSIVALKIGMAQGVVLGVHDDSPVLIGVAIALILLAVSAVATWLPARRAAEVDPASTLRAE